METSAHPRGPGLSIIYDPQHRSPEGPQGPVLSPGPFSGSLVDGAQGKCRGCSPGLPPGGTGVKSLRAATLGSHWEVHTARSRNSHSLQGEVQPEVPRADTQLHSCSPVRICAASHAQPGSSSGRRGSGALWLSSLHRTKTSCARDCVSSSDSLLPLHMTKQRPFIPLQSSQARLACTYQSGEAKLCCCNNRSLIPVTYPTKGFLSLACVSRAGFPLITAEAKVANHTLALKTSLQSDTQFSSHLTGPTQVSDQA